MAQEVDFLRLLHSTREFPLDSGRLLISIGAGEKADIRIDGDPYLSREHAVILPKEDGFMVVHRGKNPTRANNLEADQFYLRSGLIVQVGTTRLVALGPGSRALLHAVELLVGTSPRFVEAREAAQAVAQTRTNVVLYGERGSGKRTFARAIHQESVTASGPFLDLDATELDEATLGAALKAEPDRGLGGTIYLHHAERLSKENRKILSALARRLERPSAEATRLIASAVDPTATWVERLGSPEVIRVVPLRQRALDVRPLVEIFVRELSYGAPLEIPSIETAALAGLDWLEGGWNVAALRNAVRHWVADSSEGRLAVKWGSREQMESALAVAITRALADAPSRRAASEALRLPRGTLSYWMKKLDL